MDFKFVVNLYNKIQFINKKEQTTDRNNTDEFYRHYIKQKQKKATHTWLQETKLICVISISSLFFFIDKLYFII